jgi:hypothetical protein
MLSSLRMYEMHSALSLKTGCDTNFSLYESVWLVFDQMLVSDYCVIKS